MQCSSHIHYNSIINIYHTVWKMDIHKCITRYRNIHIDYREKVYYQEEDETYSLAPAML